MHTQLLLILLLLSVRTISFHDIILVLTVGRGTSETSKLFLLLLLCVGFPTNKALLARM